MSDRIILAYVFACFVIGVACLGLVLNLARRPEAKLARAFLAFYVALSAQVASTLLIALAEAFPTAIDPAARPALDYVQSIVGFYGVMFTLPYFVHRLFGVESPRRDRLLAIYVLVALGIQHVTEYAWNDVWDQRGDLLENVLFIHVFWVGISNRDSTQAARPLAGRVLAFILVGLPMIVYDVFLSDTTGVPLFPIGYCILSITVTWTLAQGASTGSTRPAVDPDWQLSERETEVLELLQRGLSNKDIGGQLFISPNTVKTHLRSIFDKAGVQSRFELIARISADPVRPETVDETAPDENHPKG